MRLANPETKSVNVSTFAIISLMCFGCNSILLFSTIYNGRTNRPPSVNIIISLVARSQVIDIKTFIKPLRRYNKHILYKYNGLRWHPTQLPFINILHKCWISVGIKSSINSAPSLITNCNMGCVLHPNVICEIIASPLFNPTFWPSGVSAGHTHPYCDACNRMRDIVGRTPATLSIIRRICATIKLYDFRSNA